MMTQTAADSPVFQAKKEEFSQLTLPTTVSAQPAKARKARQVAHSVASPATQLDDESRQSECVQVLENGQAVPLVKNTRFAPGAQGGTEHRPCWFAQVSVEMLETYISRKMTTGAMRYFLSLLNYGQRAGRWFNRAQADAEFLRKSNYCERSLRTYRRQLREDWCILVEKVGRISQAAVLHMGNLREDLWGTPPAPTRSAATATRSKATDRQKISASRQEISAPESQSGFPERISEDDTFEILRTEFKKEDQENNKTNPAPRPVKRVSQVELEALNQQPPFTTAETPTPNHPPSQILSPPIPRQGPALAGAPDGAALTPTAGAIDRKPGRVAGGEAVSSDQYPRVRAELARKDAQPTDTTSTLSSALRGRIEAAGVILSAGMLTEVLGFAVAQVETAVAFVEQAKVKKKVSNPTGLFRKALREGWVISADTAAAEQARVCHKQTQALIERQAEAQAQAECEREKVKALMKEQRGGILAQLKTATLRVAPWLSPPSSSPGSPPGDPPR